MVGCLILVQGVLTYRTYFEKWAAAATELKQLCWTQWAGILFVLALTTVMLRLRRLSELPARHQLQ